MLGRRLISPVLLALGLTTALLALGATINLLFGAGLLSDERVILTALNTSEPGYTRVQVLGRLPGSTDRDRKIRFRTSIQMPATDLACEATLHYVHQDTPVYDLVWDTTDCASAAALVREARSILDGASLPHSYILYGAERTNQVIALLRNWVAEGSLQMADIPSAENRKVISGQ